MQKRTERTMSDTHTPAIKINSAWLPYVVIAAAVAITLISIFALGTWAEASAWHHAAQHTLIFTSGAAAGVSLLGKRKARKDT
jgi:cytochrome c-type biogenesis protein CcmH/NrfG